MMGSRKITSARGKVMATPRRRAGKGFYGWRKECKRGLEGSISSSGAAGMSSGGKAGHSRGGSRARREGHLTRNLTGCDGKRGGIGAGRSTRCLKRAKGDYEKKKREE